MELKQGYKLTEVGVIPEDWEVKTLADMVERVVGGGTPSRANPKYWGNEIPWATVKDFSSFNPLQTQESITKAGLKNSASNLIPAGTLIISTRMALGKATVYQVDVAINQDLKALFLKPGIYITFLFYWFAYHEGLINGLGGGSTVKGISVNELKRLEVMLPNASEQRAIAQALSDVDALLAAQEQLIAKKRDLKQAAMQQLLTGKTRLPGFSGEWEVKRLGELLSLCYGKSQKDVEIIEGAYPILASGGQIGTASQPLYNKPSVLIGRKGTINQPQYIEKPFWTVDTLFYSVIKNNNSAKFLYYKFCLIDWLQYNEASGVPSLNARTIENIEIACPKPVEQTAIAAVLSDMDTEISALEARRDKTRALKQAMMQELLTGKTRLI